MKRRADILSNSAVATKRNLRKVTRGEINEKLNSYFRRDSKNLSVSGIASGEIVWPPANVWNDICRPAPLRVSLRI
eukprot:694881-Amorphochlora_amoeboformis.AAC.1